MPQAVDEAGNIWEVDAQGNPVRYVGKQGGQQAAPKGGVFTVPQNPAEAAKEATRQAQWEREQALRMANINADLYKQGLQLGPDGVTPVPIPNWKPTVTEATTPKITAKERADAIAAYTTANQMDRLIKDMEAKFNDGPGSTKGLMGIADFFPTEANDRFDKSAQAVRGQVGTLLGFTGGQLNSLTEAQQAVGPYLPESGNYDSTALDKISRLKDLSNLARERSIAILGGVPDQNGQITPLAQIEQQRRDPVVGLTGPGNSSVPPGNIPGGGGGPKLGLSTGESYTTPQDLAVAAAVNKALQSGASVEGLAQAAQAAGGQVTPSDLANFKAAIDARARGQSVTFNPQATGRRSPFEVSLGNAAMSPYGAAALGSADAGLLGLTDEIKAGIDSAFLGKDYTTSRDQADLFKRAAMDINPNAAMVGSIAGGVLGGAGLEGLAAKGLSRLGRGGIQGVGGALADGTVYGTAYGAGSDNQNRAYGALKGGVAGGIGGSAGYGATKLVGGTVGGVSDAAVRALSDRGISLSPGQILRNSGPLGSMVNKLESAAESVPLLGSVIKQSRENSFRDFNRAAFDEALAPIGETVGNIAEGGVGDAFDATGRGYGKALNGINIPADPQFATEIGNAVNMGRGAGGNYGTDFNQILSDQIMPLVSGKTALGGQELQDLLRITGGYSRQYGRLAETGANGIPQPMARPVAGAFDNIQQSIEGLANRQAPDVMPAYNAAKQSYRNVKVLQDAVDAAKAGTQAGEGGVFTPSQLMSAASRNSRKFGGTQGTTNQPFFDLSRAGQDVLPSTLPNSGTADRLMSGAVMGLPALAAGGAASTGMIDPSTAAWIAGISALYTKGGQKLIQKALVDRPDAARKAGSAISKRARKAGLFGAATVPALLANPSN